MPNTTSGGTINLYNTKKSNNDGVVKTLKNSKQNTTSGGITT